MKYVLVLLGLALSLPLAAQENPAPSPYKEDVASLDNILSALYGVISGEKGGKRDWDRF